MSARVYASPAETSPVRLTSAWCKDVLRAQRAHADSTPAEADCNLNCGPSIRLVGRATGAGEVFLLHFVGVELAGAFAHRLQHVLKRRRLALDPAQRVDAGDDERAQIWADEAARLQRSEEHTSELQSHSDLVCRLLLEKKKKKK